LIKVSIIIPTFSRNILLEKLLRSLVKQNVSEYKNIEVIVVDNNKKNVAKSIVDSFSFRYLHEKKAGVSYARNKAAHEAKGLYLCFLDDDEVIGENFIEEIMKFEGNIAIGKTVLEYQDKKPAWITSKIENYLSKIDYGEKKRSLKKNEWITAGNLIIDKCTFFNVGEFDTKIQRVGNKLIGNEDIILKKNVEIAGFRVEYLPKIIVKHYVPEERTKLIWLKRRAFYQGVSNSLFDKKFKRLNQEDMVANKKKRIKICNLVLKFKKFLPQKLLNSITLLKYSSVGYLR